MIDHDQQGIKAVGQGKTSDEVTRDSVGRGKKHRRGSVTKEEQWGRCWPWSAGRCHIPQYTIGQNGQGQATKTLQ